MNDISNQEQLEQWVLGNSIHIGGLEHGQCCPDFSCCNDKIDTPLEEKELFVEEYRKTGEPPMRMLGMFLSRAFATLSKKVYVAGASDAQKDQE